MADVPKITTRPFKCTDCSKGFTRQENLKRHIHTHHKGFNARNFQCTLCDARFARSDLRKRHVENCHAQPYVSPKAAVEGILSQLPLPVAPSPTPSAWLDLLMPAPAVPMNEDVADKISNQCYNRETPPMNCDLQCINTFFTSFHRNFPILHEGTFDAISAPSPMQNAIICVGSLYCNSGHNDSSRKALFDTSLASMQRYVEQNRSRYQETWVLQTFLILEFFGIYGGDDGNFLKAQRIHRDLVDAMRMLQMSHDGSSGYFDSGDEAEEGEGDATVEGPESMELRWQDFIKKESRKRCIYSLYLLDSQLAILCNLRPMLSSLEIKYDLPCIEDVWLAKTAGGWSTCKKQKFNSFNDHDDHSYASETPPAQGFFYEASQTLLHSDQEKRHPKRLRLLWASPFAAVILVVQLQMMAREITHASCLLERPKSQRRTLSILTDKQHAQISQALNGIAELVPRNKRPTFSFFDFTLECFPQLQPGDETPLWHSFWVLWYYTSITLSHPDSLLVSGVVECNLPLAIATAGHLATPRSKDKRDIYEDRDVFRILNDLELALEKLSPTKSTALPTLESPFITLLGFKICLVGWRLVRLTLGEALESSKRGARSNPCKFVLDAIMTCLDDQGDPLMLDVGFTNQPTDKTTRSEIVFLEWVIEVFRRLTSWPVGKWVAAVLEESLAKAVKAFEEQGQEQA